MAINIQDMLSGDIVKPRQQAQQQDGLAAMLSFLAQGANAQAPALPSQPNYAEMYRPNAAEDLAKKKYADDQAAFEKLKALIGSKGNGIPTPLKDAVPGTGYLGGKLDRNEFAANLIGIDNPGAQQTGIHLFNNLFPSPTKAGVGVIPTGSVHWEDPQTGVLWWKTPTGDLIRDWSEMSQNQRALQDAGQVEALATAKTNPQIRDVTLPTGAVVPMTGKEITSGQTTQLDDTNRQLDNVKTLYSAYKNGEIDEPTFHKLMSDATIPSVPTSNLGQPSKFGQPTYNKESAIATAKSDVERRVGAFDLPTMKGEIESTRDDLKKAISNLEQPSGGQKQILPKVNQWLDTNIVNDPEANLAKKIQGSKVLEILKAIGGNDSNADVEFSQIMSGLDPYYTDKTTLKNNYRKMLKALDYKEQVLDNKYGNVTNFDSNAPTGNSPASNPTGKLINGVYYKDYADYKARTGK